MAKQRTTVDIATVQDAVKDYSKLKNAKDATYLVFKHDPTTENAAAQINASNAFNQYCVEKLSEVYYLMNSDFTEVTDDMIKEHFDEYKKCDCGRTVLYSVTADDFIKSNDFVPTAKGWCYSCLVKHCKSHSCNTTSCKLAKAHLVDPTTCPHRALKDVIQGKL